MTVQEKTLHIDMPVKLTEVKIVFSIASLSFEGDLPASIFHLQLIMSDIGNWKAKSQVVAVFHTNAGHVTLHDQAYNRDRNIVTGNPYKKLVTDLIDRGVQVELCGATAKAHGWGNSDLIPGIKINTDALARTRQLVQEELSTLGPTTDSIAKELNESLSCVIINASTCLRTLAADPPNVEGARETALRTISCSNRAAEAVSRLSALFCKK